MNTRSRSTAAGQAKTEEPKAAKPVKKEVVIVSSEDEVEDIGNNDEDEEDEDYDADEPKYKPKSAATKKKQQPKSAIKKEPKATKPRAPRKVAEPKAKAEAKLAATKMEPKAEPKETLEEENDNETIYYDLNEKEMKEVNHAFDMNHSDNGEELLNADGLRTAIRSLGFEPRGDEIQRLLKKYGKRGKVNREGFHKIMTHKIGSTPGLTNDNNAKDEISRVFNLLDLDRTGFITVDNLKTIAKELNEELDDEELLEMIVEADTDGDNKIDKEDFQRIMKKTNLY